MSQAAASRQFNLDLKKEMADILEKDVPNFIKEVSISALNGIVTLNPIKTGFSSGNWIVRSQDSNELAIQKGVTNGRGAGALKAAAIRRGIADIIALAGKVPEIHLINNVHYINYLEDGSGMVAIALRGVEARYGL